MQFGNLGEVSSLGSDGHAAGLAEPLVDVFMMSS